MFKMSDNKGHLHSQELDVRWILTFYLTVIFSGAFRPLVRTSSGLYHVLYQPSSFPVCPVPLVARFRFNYTTGH